MFQGQIEIDLIDLNPYQPRTNFNEESIEDLAKSIQALGVIQPITVRKIENDNFSKTPLQNEGSFFNLTGSTMEKII